MNDEERTAPHAMLRLHSTAKAAKVSPAIFTSVEG